MADRAFASGLQTIAEFRKGNGKAIRSVFRKFVVFHRNLGLFSQSIIAIDGRKFKAVNNRGRNLTQGNVKACLQQIEQNTDSYLDPMSSVVRATPEVAGASVEWLNEIIEMLRKQVQKTRGHQGAVSG